MHVLLNPKIRECIGPLYCFAVGILSTEWCSGCKNTLKILFDYSGSVDLSREIVNHNFLHLCNESYLILSF